jgi:23S rRNA pseudouridine1911/1915/1917 synthase
MAAAAATTAAELTAMAGSGESRRLLQFAVASFGAALHSAAEAKRALKRGDLQLNGRPVAGPGGGVRLGAGDVLTLRHDAAAAAAERLRVQAPLELLYEDGQLAVVAKPAGLPSRSPLAHALVTAERALPAHLQPSADPDALGSPGLSYYLETGTTGLLLASKTLGATGALRSLAASGRLRRRFDSR